MKEKKQEYVKERNTKKKKNILNEWKTRIEKKMYMHKREETVKQIIWKRNRREKVIRGENK